VDNIPVNYRGIKVECVFSTWQLWSFTARNGH